MYGCFLFWISLLLANSFFFLLFRFLVCTLFTFFLFVWRYFWLGGLFWCFIFGSYLHFDHPISLFRFFFIWSFDSPCLDPLILSILHLDPLILSIFCPDPLICFDPLTIPWFLLILCPDSSWSFILCFDSSIPVCLDTSILCPDSSWILILHPDPLIPVHLVLLISIHLVPLILRFYSLFFHVPFFVCLFTHHLINLWLNIPVVNGLA